MATNSWGFPTRNLYRVVPGTQAGADTQRFPSGVDKRATPIAALPVDRCLSHDLAEHRLVLADKRWNRERALVIFDELHKMDGWKAWRKSIVDVEGMPPVLVVTCDARLSAFRKVGDSLAGRHFEFRLHPFDLKELMTAAERPVGETFERLLRVGGFPEPWLEGTER